MTVWLVGCVATEGAKGAPFTVSVAALLAAVPIMLLTTTVNYTPLSELVVAGVV